MVPKLNYRNKIGEIEATLMLKNLRIIFLILLQSNKVLGQITVRVFDYHPTGVFGFVMKPLISAEIGWQHSFEESRLRSGVSLTYLQMKPRMAAIPISGVLVDNGTTVLPGSESFQKYNIGLLMGDLDFAFVQQKKFNLFAGAGLMLGVADVNYTDYVQTLIDESYKGGGVIVGLRFRFGVEYIFNDYIAINVIAIRNVFLLSEPETINWANDYGIGVRYTFNP